MTPTSVTLAPIDAANLLAGQAVAAATAFLDGRHDRLTLKADADRLQLALLSMNDATTGPILQPVRLLVVAMAALAMAAHRAEIGGFVGNERLERWEQVTAALVEMIRSESRALLSGDGA